MPQADPPMEDSPWRGEGSCLFLFSVILAPRWDAARLPLNGVINNYFNT